MSENILEIRDLDVEYHTDEAIVHAVNGVNLVVRRGETLGLVGETGAGKTTIARAILRILQTPPAKFCGGEILFEGEDLVKLSESQMRHIRGNKIAMIFQDPMTALNPIEKVGWQIAETISLHNEISRVEAERRACDMLEMVGIPMERYKDYPFQFSGGMKQRVVIAMALACKPDMIIADEPTTALDVTIQAQVLELMKDLKAKYGTAVVLITHDFGVVSELCDRCAVMYGGEIVETGTLRDIFKNPRHPYTRGLFDSLPKMDDNSRLKPIKGMMPDPTKLPQHCTFAERCDMCVERCLQEDPGQTWLSDEHMVKCFRHMDTPEGRS